MVGKWVAFLMLVVSSTLAWPQVPAGRTDPSDPNAAVPPTTYRSAFDGYRIHSTVDVESWKGANDNVGRIGGWREYAKDAHRPASSTPAETPAQSKSKDAARPEPRKPHDH